MSRRVSYHNTRQHFFVGNGYLAQFFDIDVSVGVTTGNNNFKTGHYCRCRIGSVS